MTPLTPPPGHQLVRTEDGSYTLHSERFGEACHSTSGARHETEVHYLRGCGIPELLAAQKPFAILEVGFGTGLGWRATRTLQEKEGSASVLTFVSLELDEELVRWSAPEARRQEQDGRVWYQQDTAGATLMVLLGDARQVLPAWRARLPRFQAVYQDAFSPRRNPTLWTRQWFQLLGELCVPGARLATYSASISIRKALHESGWGISQGEAFARKRSSTRARWQESSDPQLVAELMQHPTPALSDAETP